MPENTKPSLSGVAETLLITLYIRATESQRPDALIKDERAEALVGKLDPETLRKTLALTEDTGRLVLILKSREFDRFAQDFLGGDPVAVGGHIGCGLGTRFGGVDNGQGECDGLLEYRAGWVYGDPSDADKIDHPIAFYVPDRSGLYQEIMIAATQLNLAYYGWRQGTFQSIKFSDGTTLRGNPTINAGSVALQHLFGMLSRQESWLNALYGTHSFLILYTEMFGDAWSREQAIGPIFPLGVSQPPLELPSLAGERWALTAGPHNAWNAGTPRAALDLSPVKPGEAVCAVSAAWVRASASGVVAPSRPVARVRPARSWSTPTTSRWPRAASTP